MKMYSRFLFGNISGLGEYETKHRWRVSDVKSLKDKITYFIMRKIEPPNLGSPNSLFHESDRGVSVTY